MPKQSPFSRDDYFKRLDEWLSPTPFPQGKGLSREELGVFLQNRKRRNGQQVLPVPPLPRGS